MQELTVMSVSETAESAIANDGRDAREAGDGVSIRAHGTGYGVRERGKIAAEGFEGTFGERHRDTCPAVTRTHVYICTLAYGRHTHTHTYTWNAYIARTSIGASILAIRENDATERKEARCRCLDHHQEEEVP